MARRLHLESRDVVAEVPARETASSFVQSFGWRAPREWIEVDRDGAIEVVSSALMNDLVTDAPRMPFREAEERARSFVEGCPEDSVFFTNAALAESRMGFGRKPLTQGRADTGVIFVAPGRVGMFWIED